MPGTVETTTLVGALLPISPGLLVLSEPCAVWIDADGALRMVVVIVRCIVVVTPGTVCSGTVEAGTVTPSLVDSGTVLP